ncbi:MAG: DUF4097 family beta strand repeat-containing protein [Bowdeniella nasicola]|nr:DUF4097 family beta strand repeat-containing protein [Bowdeniella nasicola]
MQTILYQHTAPSEPITIHADCNVANIVVSNGDELSVLLEGDEHFHHGARCELRDNGLYVHLPAQKEAWHKTFFTSIDRKIPRLNVIAPAGTHINMRTLTGSLRMDGRFGNIHATSNAGSIVAGEVELLSARANAGKITVERVQNIDAVCDAGGVKIGAVGSGKIHVSAGQVRIGEVTGTVQLHADAGSIRIDHARACTLDAVSSLGSIKVAVEPGIPVWTDCHASTGKVRTNLQQTEHPEQQQECARIRARTTVGSIELERARG